MYIFVNLRPFSVLISSVPLPPAPLFLSALPGLGLCVLAHVLLVCGGASSSAFLLPFPLLGLGVAAERGRQVADPTGGGREITTQDN